MGSKGYSFMLALFTCEIFSKWYREMDTICSPAVLFWQEPLRTLYGNEFCLSLMKTLLSTQGSRNWRTGVNIRLVVLPLIQTDDSFLGQKWNLCFLVCVSITGNKSHSWEMDYLTGLHENTLIYYYITSSSEKDYFTYVQKIKFSEFISPKLGKRVF